MVGTMDHWIQQQQQQQQQQHRQLQQDVKTVQMASSSQKLYNPYTAVTENDIDNDNVGTIIESDEDSPPSSVESIPVPPLPQPQPMPPPSPSASSMGHQNQNKYKQEPKNALNKFWPPWPFNLRMKQQDSSSSTVSIATSTSRRRGPALHLGGTIWSSFGQRARVGIKEMQYIGSSLWFHLPPMTPPLIFLTILPRQQQTVADVVGEGVEKIVTKNVIPLFSNPLARSLVLGGFGLSVLSWAHSELTRMRKLTPLPLNDAYRDIHRAVLPHVLPDAVPEPFLLEDEDEDEDEDAGDAVENIEKKPEDGSAKDKSSISQKLAASVPPRLQKHFQRQLDSDKSKSKTKNRPWSSMRRMRNARKAEAQKVRRMEIYDELVALQAIKRKAQQEQNGQRAESKSKGRHKEPTEDEPMGYALVTGASRGIGRALAVELARWEIPLILVARDLPRLTSLAYDIEACYGVKCCVLQADLSQPHAAEQIHEATKEAGLTVDILVNNAGVSSTGLAVDMSLQEVNRMMIVNGLSVAQLAHLYGRDMKERKRGRILMVSSVVGACQAGPTVALYAATKGFEKILGLSMAKELEPYGVGVTCLMPGAVRDTDFRDSSDTKEALCWKLPYYPKSPSTVAKAGVQSLLAGQTEITPGWQNRVLLKVVKPAIPQRLHNIMIEIAWNPPRMSPFLKFWKTSEGREMERRLQLEGRRKEYAENTERKGSMISDQEWRPRSNTYLPPPFLLSVPGTITDPSSPMHVTETDKKPAREATLIGQNPAASASDPEPTSSREVGEANPKEQTEMPEGRSHNESQYEDFLDKLTLGGGSEGARTSDKTNSYDTATSPHTSSEQVTPSHPSSRQRETERELLKMQEETLKLQQRLQEQERKQFLEQIEFDRRKRELETERKQFLEHIEFDRRKREFESEKRERDSLREQRENSESSKNEHGLQWRKRKARSSQSNRETNIPKPKLLVPRTPRLPPRKSGPDLMDESLEHPLLSP